MTLAQIKAELLQRLRRIGRWITTNIFPILDVVKLIGILVLIMMFIRFSVTVADNTRQAKETTQATQRIVKSQGDILQAIQALAVDTKITAEQKTNIIICMLQVPVEERTTDVLTGCRQQAEGSTQAQALSVQPTQSQGVINPPPPASSTQTINLPPPESRSFLDRLGDRVNRLLRSLTDR